MTPQQEPLSGVIICPVLKEGTAVKGELLHHNQQFNYTPEEITCQSIEREIERAEGLRLPDL
jgi:hypothetical protein